MDTDKVQPILIVILGSICALFLVVGPVMLIWDNRHALPLMDEVGSMGSATVSGEEAWQEKSAEHAREEGERQAQLREFGIDSRYEIIAPGEETRALLYVHKDFAGVEAILNEHFAGRIDPLSGHRYSRYVSQLSNFYDDDPVRTRAVLDEWVEMNPAVYQAWMIRGMFFIRYAGYFRGTGYANTVSGNSWAQHERMLTLAKSDLEKAQKLNSKDPEIPANLIGVARGLSLGTAQSQRYYDEAITADPLNLTARIAIMTSALPKWGGTWREVDVVLAECEASSAQFPLLGIVIREAQKQMGDRGGSYKEALEDKAIYREWAEPYIAQLQFNPDDLELKANLAYFAAKGLDFELAEQYFQELGDRYYDNTNFKDLLEYNDYRAWVHANTAFKLEGPDRGERVLEAFQMSPNHYFTNYAYGVQCANFGDTETARACFETSVSRNPSYAAAHLALAQLDCHQGRQAEAVQGARKVLGLETNEDQRRIANEVLKNCG